MISGSAWINIIAFRTALLTGRRGRIKDAAKYRGGDYDLFMRRRPASQQQ
jgi:hypothetical protein